MLSFKWKLVQNHRMKISNLNARFSLIVGSGLLVGLGLFSIKSGVENQYLRAAILPACILTAFQLLTIAYKIDFDQFN